MKELLSQEAKQLGVVGTPQKDGDGRLETKEDAAIRALIDQEIDIPVATEHECRRYYENNLNRFSSETIHEVRHILVPAKPSDRHVREQAREQAEVIIDLLTKNPGDFGGLAREFSACPSSKQGGNLGQITRGETVAEFETALEMMRVGDVSEQPVETPYGFHIIALDRKIEGQTLPFELASERISGWLQAASWARAVAQYVGILSGKANIKGIELAGSDGLLVQ